jgi:hypothetical protein
VKLIDNRVLEPKLVAFELRRRSDVSDHVHGKGLYVRQRNSSAGSCC